MIPIRQHPSTELVPYPTWIRGTAKEGDMTTKEVGAKQRGVLSGRIYVSLPDTMTRMEMRKARSELFLNLATVKRAWEEKYGGVVETSGGGGDWLMEKGGG